MKTSSFLNLFSSLQFLFTLFVVSIMYSQNYNGPGGIGSDADNRFWFDSNSLQQADGANVNSWSNQGGNNTGFTQTSANQQPQFMFSGPNNQSELNFDGVNDYFNLANNSDLNSVGPWNERSFIMVFTTGLDITSRQVLYEEGGGLRGLNIYIEGGELFFSGYNQPNDGAGSPWGTPAIEQVSTTGLTTSTTYILSVIYNQDGGDNTSGTFEGFLNNASFGTANSIGILYAHTGDINLGANEDSLYPTGSGSDLYPFSGAISEFLIYNRSLTTSERIIINNYLSAKYDVPLVFDDEYSQDNPLAGNYDFNVIGARQEGLDTSLDANFGTGIVGLSDVIIFGNGSLYLGSDSQDQTDVLISSGCTASNNEIMTLSTTWRVSLTSSIFQLAVANIELDLSKFNLSLSLDPSDFAILVDDNPGFTSPNIFPANTITSEVVNFENVLFTNNTYITFEIAADKAVTNSIAGLNFTEELRFHFEANSIDQTNGTDVTNWNNQGANSLDAQTQVNSPSIINDTINNQHFIEFDRSNSESLIIANNSDINEGAEPWSQRTYSLVFQTSSDINSRQVLYEEGGVTRGLNIYIFNGNLYFGAYNNSNDGSGSPWNFKSVLTPISTNTTYILTNVFNGNSTTSGRLETYLNGESVGVANGVGYLYDHSANISLGQNGDGTIVEGNSSTNANHFFDGLLGEFLFYDTVLNENQIDLLNNFLMGKYGVEPSLNDIYAFDTPTEGDFDFNLVGVRQDLSGNRLDNSTFSTGIVKFSNPSSLGVDEYILAASNLEDQTKVNGEDNDCTTANADDLKLEAIWRVNLKGAPGTIDLEFLAKRLNILPQSEDDIRLLIDDNSEFSSPAIISPTSFCSVAVFEAVNFNNGDYFTLQLQDVEPVIWDGSIYANGSGVSNEPNSDDISRKFVVNGVGAVLTDDFGCGCIFVTEDSEISLDNLTAEIKGDINNQGTINTISSSFNLTGKTIQNVSGNGFPISNLILDNFTGANLNLNANQSIDLFSSLKLNNGNFAANGQLIFKSTPTESAVLSEVSNASDITGCVTVERYIPSGNRAFRYIAPPVETLISCGRATIQDNLQEGNQVTNFNNYTGVSETPGFGTHITGSTTGQNGFDATITGNSSMFTWEPATQDWLDVPNTNVKGFDIGEPFALLVRGGRELDLTVNNSQFGSSTKFRYTGQLHTKTYSTSNLTSTIDDFNLVANPYQAQVDMKALLESSDASGINPNFMYVFVPNAATRGAYVTVDLSSTSGNETSPAGSSANRYLQPNQSVFLQTIAINPSLTFEEIYKKKTQQSLDNQTFSLSQTGGVYVELKRYVVSENEFITVDGARLKFNNQFTNSVEHNDALKFWNSDESLAILTNDEYYLSVERRAYPESQESVQLYCWGLKSTNYQLTLSLSQLEQDLILIDHYAGTETPVPTNSEFMYEFTADETIPESISNTRFELVFNASSLSTVDNEKLNLRVYPNPTSEVVHIDLPNLSGKEVRLEFIDMSGRVMASETLKAQGNTISTQVVKQLSAGVYNIRLSNDNQVYSHKIIVN